MKNLGAEFGPVEALAILSLTDRSSHLLFMPVIPSRATVIERNKALEPLPLWENGFLPIKDDNSESGWKKTEGREEGWGEREGGFWVPYPYGVV